MIPRGGKNTHTYTKTSKQQKEKQPQKVGYSGTEQKQKKLIACSQGNGYVSKDMTKTLVMQNQSEQSKVKLIHLMNLSENTQRTISDKITSSKMANGIQYQ